MNQRLGRLERLEPMKHLNIEGDKYRASCLLLVRSPHLRHFRLAPGVWGVH
jgi:hypothetical protein